MAKITAKKVKTELEKHNGEVRFGMAIIARVDEAGKVEGRFLSPKNIWGSWMPTDAAEIASKCDELGIDTDMIVRQ